jgi:hypothetical protein
MVIIDMSEEQLKEINFLVSKYTSETLNEETSMNETLIQAVSSAVADKVVKTLTNEGICDLHDWIG